MGRPLRQFVARFTVHVTQRGNGRMPVFRCESDFRYMWRCLKEASEKFEVDVNAYVFMTNHIHLLVTPGEPPRVSNLMQVATKRYSEYFNIRYDRAGSLWEGRFRASLVAYEPYLLACHRYIDLNPVRARMAATPGDYEWSSHRFYAYGEHNPLVAAHRALSCLGEDEPTRRRAYVAMFQRPIDSSELSEIRDCCKSGKPIGE
jgi:putative transposase